MKNKKIDYAKIVLVAFFVLLIGLYIIIYNANNNENKKYGEGIETTTKIPILTFHRIVPDNIKNDLAKDNQWVAALSVFESQMQYLHDNNYTTLSMDEFYNWYKGNKEYDNKTVMIAFDDGYYEEYYYVYPILKKYNLKGTTFIIGDKVNDTIEDYKNNIDELFWGMDAINEVKKDYSNFDFQSHTYGLHYRVNEEGKRYKVDISSIEDLNKDFDLQAKFNFRYLAYPFGGYTNDIQTILKERKYKMAFAFGPDYEYATRKDKQYTIPRIKINGEMSLDDFIDWVNY